MPRTRFLQSAVIPYRVRPDGDIEVCLITSRNGKRWIVPKGLIDPGEDPCESAVRECEEEAGLIGRADPDPIGRYTYRKWGGVCDVDVFLMRVTEVRERWPEQSFRKREWLSIDDALTRLNDEDLCEIVRGLKLARRQAS